MRGNTAYLDSSAFIKTVIEEPHSAAIRDRLLRWPSHASSTLLRTECVRALNRSGNTNRVGEARRLLSELRLIRLDETLLDRAGELAPLELRSLDAIHLAAALAIGPDLGALFTYDERLMQAAMSHGLNVEVPR
ncbi:MAG: type II toxin-antitoxin system VapC family toxin [Nocardioidaceae bacterium]